MSAVSRIKTAQDVNKGAQFLAGLSPAWSAVIAQTAPLPLRLKDPGFATLLDAIVGQQVSIASAAAIWARLDAAGLTREINVQKTSPAQLAACGLSKPKVRYALALANAGVDWDGLADLDDKGVIARLTTITGIGPWTAEIYALTALGRPDIMPAGDLALQEAAKLAFNLPARPTETEFRTMAEAWAPYRSVAARALWAYYRLAKQREGIR